MSKRGWFDALGPLRFLRPRWSGGPRWRKVWIRFYAGDIGVSLQSVTQKGGYPQRGSFLCYDYWGCMDYRGKEDWVMGWIKKMSRPDPKALDRAQALDREWLESYPALHEYLTATTDEEGAKRATATLTLFSEQGGWKVFLNERQVGASLCSAGDSISEALSGLEVLLESEDPPWRWKTEEGRPGGKGKGRRT